MPPAPSSAVPMTGAARSGPGRAIPLIRGRPAMAARRSEAGRRVVLTGGRGEAHPRAL